MPLLASKRSHSCGITLLDLPDDILARIARALLPSNPRARLSCLSHADAIRDAHALARAAPRLGQLWSTCVLRDYGVCNSCQFLAPGAQLATICWILEHAHLQKLQLGECGWARAGLSNLLNSIGLYGQRLQILDLSKVEFGRHGVAQTQELESMLTRLATFGTLKELKLWAGTDRELKALENSRISALLRSLALFEVSPLQTDIAYAAISTVLRDSQSNHRCLMHLNIFCSHFEEDMDVGNEEESSNSGMQNMSFDANYDSSLSSSNPAAPSGALCNALALNVPQYLYVLHLSIPDGVQALMRAAVRAPMQNLYEAYFIGTGDVTGTNMASLVTAIPSLKRVGLRRCQIREQSLRAVLLSLGALLVEFIDCYNWRDAHELNLLKVSCPNVEKLSLYCDIFAVGFAALYDEDDSVDEYDIAREAFEDAVVNLCNALGDKLKAMEIDDSYLSDRSLQLAVAAAPHLEELTIRWEREPDGRHDFWMLRNKSCLRRLVMRPVPGESWQWSSLGVVNAAWYCRHFCPRLEHFGLTIPCMRSENDCKRVWRALDRLQARAPMVCTAMARSKLFHPHAPEQPSLESRSVEEDNLETMDADDGFANVSF